MIICSTASSQKTQPHPLGVNHKYKEISVHMLPLDKTCTQGSEFMIFIYCASDFAPAAARSKSKIENVESLNSNISFCQDTRCSYSKPWDGKSRLP